MKDISCEKFDIYEPFEYIQIIKNGKKKNVIKNLEFINHIPCQWIFIDGARTIGKTFQFKKLATFEYLKSGKKFIYLRRYDTEDNSCKEFFEDIYSDGELADYEFKTYDSKAYIKRPDSKVWEQYGYFVYLSVAARKNKSTPYPNVKYLGYDEFLIDDPFVDYLDNEPFKFADFYNTVDREEDRVIAILTANATAAANPYYQTFNCPFPYSEKISYVDDYFAFWHASPPEPEECEKSKFRKIFENTEYGKYAFKNIMKDTQSLTNIKNTPKGVKARYCFILGGEAFAVYPHDEKIYIKRKEKNSSLIKIALDKISLENLEQEKNNYSYKFIINLVNCSKQNRLYFSDIFTRSKFNKYFKRFGDFR